MSKKALSEKDNVKYLGILIDSTLSWKYHIDSVSKKISKTIGILYKIRYFVDIKIIKTILQPCLSSFNLWNRSMGFS